MNKQRRDEIRKIKDELDDITYRLEELIEEEQTAFDNLPESIQTSEKGEIMEENVGTLQMACDEIGNVALDLENFL